MIPHSSAYGRPRATVEKSLVIAGASAVALAVYCGAVFASGAPRSAWIMPVALVMAGALTVVAVTRFTLFLVIVLAIRSSLDAAKLADIGATVDGGGGQPTASSLFDPSSMLAVLFICAGLAWLVVQGRRPIEARPHPALPMAALTFFGACLFSLLGSRAPAVSVGEVSRVAAFLVMIFVVERLVAEDPGRRGPLLGAVFASGVVPVLVTFYQVVTGNGLVDLDGLMRPVGTFWHPNALGEFCYTIMIMGVALLWHVRGGARVALFLLVAGLGAALVTTAARGAWIAALVGVLVVGFLQDRRIILGAVAVVGGVVLAVPSVLARFSDLSQTYTAGGYEANSLVWRFDHWIEATGLLPENPVTGVGLGTARLFLYKEVHNDYVRALVESGVVGLLAYLGLLAALFIAARQALRATARPPGLRVADPSRGIAVGFTGCVAAFAVSALADNIMTAVVVMWYLAVFAGLALRIGAPGKETQ
ncbi:O-antigen ligase domain-containing protein [Sphaerisporangium album]|uniref:O-antigen ligase domain-containing protein n=1 Tax=Sphaerisporangium album TaxID=509200 RepID=A0A367FKQ8_9ACTN|nr:O-antigen ligase family protein [Sphaerisporangium album]RCG30983.1 O-antigen ligase domain-containing protein [Sphaerisporangium album]